MSVTRIRYTVPPQPFSPELDILPHPYLWLFLGWMCIAGSPAQAHEIPNKVYVQAIVSVENNTLHFLVRAPLSAMRDIKFPLTGAGNLDTEQLDSYLQDAALLWIADYTEFYEDGRLLPAPTNIFTRISMPSNRAFSSYSTAWAHINSPYDSLELTQEQAQLDIHFEYPVQSRSSQFSIRPALGHLGRSTDIVLRYITPDAREHLYTFKANTDNLQLDPGYSDVSIYFVEAGFLHILSGADHLLFLLCLLIPIRKIRELLFIITAFTLAHSLTLAASALNLVPQANWFPTAIEALIATSIVYMALENCLRKQFEQRWIMALGFGLIHGFGFSYALAESLQFSGSHLLTSLLAFNLGVELGQILFVAVALTLLSTTAKKLKDHQYALTIIASVFIAHTAWHWTLERIKVLGQFPFTLAQVDMTLFAQTLRWCILSLAIALLAWAFGKLIKNLR